MKTRDRILDTALGLFNQAGVGAVSTNHIAEAASISPGNLYYHFSNKEEIVRSLFERLYAEWDEKLALPDDHMPTLDDAFALVRTNFIIMWQYRFVYREVLTLLRQDAELHARYIIVRRRGYDGFRQLIGLFSQAGVLVVPNEATVIELADLCWLISEFWLANVEINGETVSEPPLEHGIQLMLRVLQPYIQT